MCHGGGRWGEQLQYSAAAGKGFNVDCFQTQFYTNKSISLFRTHIHIYITPHLISTPLTVTIIHAHMYIFTQPPILYKP